MSPATPVSAEGRKYRSNDIRLSPELELGVQSRTWFDLMKTEDRLTQYGIMQTWLPRIIPP